MPKLGALTYGLQFNSSVYRFLKKFYAAINMVKLTTEGVASDVPVEGFISVCLMSPFKMWPLSGLFCKNSSRSS
jgi:hypothetical protein